MSSEVYIRWQVRNLENLHRQLQQQLAIERQQQAELFKAMQGNVNSLRTQIVEVLNASSKTEQRQNIRKTKMSNIYDNDTDDISSNGFKEAEFLKLEIKCEENGNTKKLATIDWSEKLEELEDEVSDRVRILSYIKSIEAQLDNAVVISEQDKEAKNAFVAYLNNLMSDEELEFDYFELLVEKRFSQLKKSLEFVDPEAENSELFEYYALCKMLSIEPKQMSKTEMQLEIQKMTVKLLQKKKEEFVFRNLKEVFQELNLNIEDEIELDGLVGNKIKDDNISDCSIFMSADGDGIIFETVAEVDDENTLSANRKALIEESAYKVCQKHMEVIRRMRERGIYFQIECEEKPKAERIRKIKKRHNQHHQKQKGKELYIGG